MTEAIVSSPVANGTSEVITGLFNKDDIVLEDYLIKKGNRSLQLWHERYFVFTTDNTLYYFHKKGDSKPRAAFSIDKLSDCEVSDLYVEKQKRQKHNELVYCIRITWTSSSDQSLSNSQTFDDASSLGGQSASNLHPPGITSPASPQSPKSQNAMENTEKDISKDQINVATATKRKKTSLFKKPPRVRRSVTAGEADKKSDGNNMDAAAGGVLATPKKQSRQNDANQNPKSPRQRANTAEDNNSVSLSKRVKRRFTPKSSNYSKAAAEAASIGAAKVAAAPIPSLVECDTRRSMIASPPFANETVSESSAGELPTNSGHKNSNGTLAKPNGMRNAISLVPQLPPTAARPGFKSYKEQQEEEQELLVTEYLSNRKEKKKKSKKKVVQGTKLAVAAGATVGLAVVTAGVGLIAGLVVLGASAAAGGGSAAFQSSFLKKRTGELIIATADYEKAKRWKALLDASLESDSLRKSTWGNLFLSEGRKSRLAFFPNDRSGELSKERSSPGQDRQRTVLLEGKPRWQPLEGGWTSFLGTGAQGLRIFCEEDRPTSGKVSSCPVLRLMGMTRSEGPPCPPMKAQLVLSTSPLDAFLCLMSFGRVAAEFTEAFLMPMSGHRASFRVVECIDDNADVIHLVFRPMYLFPSWTLPRDFVLFRYWRLEPDGSYVVCYETVEHRDCPPVEGFVRGEMHQVFTIAPQKKLTKRKASTVAVNKQFSECLMTAVVQVDPKGWVPVTPLPLLTNQTYGHAFGISALMHLMDIRDAIDQDRFVSVTDNDVHLRGGRSYDYELAPPGLAHNQSIDSHEDLMSDDTMINYDFAYANRESRREIATNAGLCTHPPPLNSEKWAEPDSNSFRIRGKSYKYDKQKINAGPSIGRLVAVDLVSVDEPIYSGLSAHPSERVQLALQREKALKEKGLPSDLPPFIFVVNLVLPGPPFYHAAFYYAVDDMSTIDGSDGTPSSKLCQRFFFGDSDEFRDKTFKLIPQIVEGNFIVRKAVGSTPAIMGTKLRQLYVKTERSFEVVLDCGSSAVATGVIRLSLGYAKTLVVDMGFLLEGDDETTLPERIFGCVRMKKPDFGSHLRKVLQPQP